jgi:DNA-binding NarL/FixJ family response regulator
VIRARGGRPYGGREQAVLARCHDRLAAQFGRGLVLPTRPNLHGLTPRRRQLLACLLEGDSEKEAALRLGLRPTTVHEYAKQLYRHFGVSSRPELLAYYLRRYGPVTAALTPRLQEVLGRLLEGDSEKQAARRLGISPATVHDHVKRLYVDLGVSSRGELFAHFLRASRRPAGPASAG